MKNLRLLAFVGTSFFVSSAMVLVACSDDDTVVTVTPDSGNTDSGPGPGKDGGGTPDSNVPDTSPPFDGGLKLDTFAGQVADALCDRLTFCCFGQTNVPDGGALDGGGNFNRGRCLANYHDLGFEDSLLGDDAITQGKVNLDQAKGADCLAKIKALQCNLTGADLKAARAACFGALTGTVANGGACRASIECAPGHFCLPDADGGVVDGGAVDAGGGAVIGKCAPLRGAGGKCSITESGGAGSNEEIDDSNRAEQACSYRGGGDTNLRCGSYDVNDPGAGYSPRDQWTCQPTVANGTSCNSTVWCSDGICDPTDFTCRSPVEYFNGNACTAYKL